MDPYAPTDTDAPGYGAPRYDGGAVRLTEIRRIDIVSVAKLTAMLYGAIGLMFGGLYGVVMILVGVVGAATGEPEALVAAVGGVFMILFIPVFYGVIGAVFAAIAALIYNLVAGRLGGIRIELHDV